MNSNNGQSSGMGARQSTGSMNNGNYTPFMFGASYGPGYNTSRSQAQIRTNDSVGSCMYWPNSLDASSLKSGDQPSYSSNYNNQSASSQPFNFFTGNARSSAGSTQQSQVGRARAQPEHFQGPNRANNYPQPTAFMQMPGQGGQGEIIKPMSIPCQMGPLGTNPADMLQHVEPLTIKVVAPPGGNPGGTTPMTFQVGQHNLQ